MNELCRPDLPIELLARFFRTLNHELRNPLSVISNELYVLQAEGHAVDAALDAVRRVDSVLQLCQGFVSGGAQESELDIEQYLLDRGFTVNSASSDRLVWRVSESSFPSAFGEFFRLLDGANLLQERVVVREHQKLIFKLSREIPGRENTEQLLPSLLFQGTTESSHPALPFIDALFVQSRVSWACFELTNLILYQE